MLEFILGVFVAPFVLAGVLWSALAWWSWLLLVLGVFAVEAAVYNKADFFGFLLLMVTAFVIAYIIVPESSSFWAEIGSAVKLVLVGMIDYLILGILVAIPLWIWEVRKRLVYLRTKLCEFVHDRAKQKTYWTRSRLDEEQPLTEDQIEHCEFYKEGDSIPEFLCDNWSHYRQRDLGIRDGSTKVSENIDQITGYIFLWPFHLVTIFFGDILVSALETFVRYFGVFVDALAKVVRIGIPKGIDS